MTPEAKPREAIIADGTGAYSPNPKFYGFDWPDVQAVFERGHRLFERRNALGREQEDLAAEKRGLEQDLVRAGAALELAAVGMEDTQIAGAAAAIDVPKSGKRITAIEKRLTALDSDLAALDMAAQRHRGELEQVLAASRQDGLHAAEVMDANALDLGDLADLEAKAQEIRLRLQARERLGELVGLPASGLVA